PGKETERSLSLFLRKSLSTGRRISAPRARELRVEPCEYSGEKRHAPIIHLHPSNRHDRRKLILLIAKTPRADCAAFHRQIRNNAADVLGIPLSDLSFGTEHRGCHLDPTRHHRNSTAHEFPQRSRKRIRHCYQRP